MLLMTIEQSFKEYFFNYFIEWEKKQPNKRSTYSAFARWLSENSYDVNVKQQNVDAWIKGVLPKDYKYVMVLAEKIGDEIYELLNVKKPNPYLQIVNKQWEFASPERQKQIAEEFERYETQNESERISKTSKRRKAGKAQ